MVTKTYKSNALCDDDRMIRKGKDGGMHVELRWKATMLLLCLFSFARVCVTGQESECYDTNGESKDSFNDTCDWYEGESRASYCGSFDDNDFSARDHCCACNGGCFDITNGVTDASSNSCNFYENNTEYCGRNDDSVFSASSLCCNCNGGCRNSAGNARDTYGDGCDWYQSRSSNCGYYDDDDFTASAMCCECNTHSIIGDQCYDIDEGVFDTYGDGCEWYDLNDVGQCGKYDDNDFTASSLCCRCGGGCKNEDNGATDEYGNTCLWYFERETYCGIRDDVGFDANVMCCSCKSYVKNTNLTNSTDMANETFACYDFDNGVYDSASDTCEWYDARADSCGFYDDEDFNASQICCACAGGCTNTDNGTRDSGGDDCEWYAEGNEFLCGHYDTENFTASELCCACKDGFRIDYSPTCIDMDFDAVDSHGDDCEWYVGLSLSTCGVYDTEDFVARRMCCACQGGCENTNRGAVDRLGDGCDFYVDNEASCGHFDDDDFTADVMCCVCIHANSTTFIIATTEDPQPGVTTKEPGTVTYPIAPKTTDTVYANDGEGDNNDAGVAVGVSIGVIAGLLVIASIGFCMYKRTARHGAYGDVEADQIELRISGIGSDIAPSVDHQGGFSPTIASTIRL